MVLARALSLFFRSFEVSLQRGINLFNHLNRSASLSGNECRDLGSTRGEVVLICLGRMRGVRGEGSFRRQVGTVLSHAREIERRSASTGESFIEKSRTIVDLRMGVGRRSTGRALGQPWVTGSGRA